MALTKEDRVAIYNALSAEERKALKAFEKAWDRFDTSPVVYGGSVERETAAVMMNLRKAQLDAARAAASEYFNAYVLEAA